MFTHHLKSVPLFLLSSFCRACKYWGWCLVQWEQWLHVVILALHFLGPLQDPWFHHRLWPGQQRDTIAQLVRASRWRSATWQVSKPDTSLKPGPFFQFDLPQVTYSRTSGGYGENANFLNRKTIIHCSFYANIRICPIVSIYSLTSLCFLTIFFPQMSSACYT